jgi:hypothetical protein
MTGTRAQAAPATAHGTVTRWMAALFAIGSTCFLAASVASQWASSSRPAIGVTFFAGSLLFTAAAYLQYAQAVRRIDRRAAAIQLAGTLAFNVSTLLAMQHGLDARQTDLRVWAPDAAGSVCFLLSSALAYAQVRRRARSVSWWIAALNLLGSIAFGIAAIASLVEPASGVMVNVRITNAGTSIGAACFLAGALLLPREARESSGSGEAG